MCSLDPSRGLFRSVLIVSSKPSLWMAILAATMGVAPVALGQTPLTEVNSELNPVTSSGEVAAQEVTSSEGAPIETAVQSTSSEEVSAVEASEAVSEGVTPDVATAASPPDFTKTEESAASPSLEAPANSVLWSTDYLSQTPESAPPEQPIGQPAPPAPVVPEPGTGGDPQQETPDRIEFDITPGSPNLQIDQPPPAPTPEVPNPGDVTPSPATQEPEARVLVAEVNVTLSDGAQISTEQRTQLIDEVYGAIATVPGRTTTRTQLQEDINAIFATGFFANVRAIPEDTPLGVRVTFAVQPNPVLSRVQIQANPGTEVPSALEPGVAERIFSPQYGSILNFRSLQQSIQELNKWYQDSGFVLAQVIEAPQVSPEGVVTLQVAEGVIEDIQVRFLNREGEPTDEEGRPIRGTTRDFIVTRELDLQPGEIFNRRIVEADLQRVFGLGIFQDVRLSLNPGTDPRKVQVVVNVQERNTGSIGAAAGFSSASGLFGSVSYQQQNLGGNNQQLRTELTLGQREFLFDASFTDPWIAGDPNRTAYTINFFRRRSLSLIFDGGPDQVRLPNDDRPRVLRTGGGLTFTRPLGVDKRNPEWTASLGLQYQRVSIRDADGDLAKRDELGNLLSFSNTGKDDLFTVQAGLVRDRRNDRLRPTQGNFTRISMEQSIPIGLGTIFMNRVRGSYSHYIPVRFTRFTDGPQALAFNVQGGGIIGDLPPYEAFALGGSNSIRGYDEGDVGSGRYFVQASAEYRFPVFRFLGGVLFVDAGTDLGSGSSVPGDPAGARDKPGTGVGFGAGVRIQSPIGPIRIDLGINDGGDRRIHFGIGERF